MLTQDDLMAIATLMEKTIDQKLEPIKERLDGVDKRLDGMGKRLDGVDEQLKELEPIKERLDGMDEQLKELEPIKERLDGMDEQLKELEPIKERLDGMDEQLKVLDKKNTDTRSVIETQIEHAIRLLAEGHAQIVESMVKPAQLEEVHPRLDTLENVVSVHSKEIRELQQKIG